MDAAGFAEALGGFIDGTQQQVFAAGGDAEARALGLDEHAQEIAERGERVWTIRGGRFLG